jgi:hypothetical protein
VVALGDVGGPTGGIRVGRGGGGEVAVELVWMAADGVPPVPPADHLAQLVGLAQPGGGPRTWPTARLSTAPGPGAPGRR